MAPIYRSLQNKWQAGTHLRFPTPKVIFWQTKLSFRKYRKPHRKLKSLDKKQNTHTLEFGPSVNLKRI